MSDAKKYRDANKEKARRLATQGSGKVDASSWTPDEPMNTDRKTGLRPVSRQHLKTGGKVHGNKSVHRADRTVRVGNRSHHATGGRSMSAAAGERPMSDLMNGGKPMEAAENENAMANILRGTRASGGKAVADSNVNRNVKKANAELGKYHVGGMRSGGRARRADGGSAVPTARMEFSASRPNMINKTGGAGLKKGGAAKHSDAAEDKAMIKKMIRPSALKKCSGGTVDGSRPDGGRMPRASGGRTKGKGKTNINIIIGAQGRPEMGEGLTMPPPMPGRPPGIPVAVPPGGGGGGPMPAPPQGMPMPPPPPPQPPQQPMPRKSGGRAYRSYKDMDAGALGGKGRLEKTEIQRSKR